MNDGQYTNLRNYLEEIASTTKQVLVEQQRTNELLTAGQAGKQPAATPSIPKLPAAPSTPKVPAEAVGPVTVETVEMIDQHGKEHKPVDDSGMFLVPSGTDLKPKDKPDAHLAAVTQKVDTSKSKKPVEVTPETTKRDFTVTVEDEPKPKTSPKKGKPGVKPNVNWNS